jgi:D-inositol-3-phosphate glycosyltransferase
MSDKPRVLWVSDLVTPTGFSRVSHSILETLSEKYDVVGLGVNYRGDPHNYPYPVYPASAGGRIFGEDRMVAMLNGSKFDLIFILNDTWVINNYLVAIKRDVKNPPPIVVYFPVDSKDHDQEWYLNFDIVNRAVTYTEFGKAVVNDGKCVPDMRVDVIPHGVNSEVFYKKFTNRKDAKKNLLEKASKPDSFVFLSANRNQPRKKLDVTMEGFKIFANNKDDVLLHMHCGVRDASMDITKLAIRYGIDNKLILTNLNPGVQTVSDTALNDIYNAADVGINTSLGEGWGLTSIEHAMTGAPQIVPDHSACAEIFSDCGLLVPVVAKITFDNTMTAGGLVSPQGLAEKMNLLYSDRTLYKKLSQKSIEKFSDPKYTWKEIAKQWDKIFTEVLTDNADTLASPD